MANAKIETVTKTVEKEIEEKVYTLTLSEDEAKVIRAFVGWVAGSPSNTYAKYTQPVFNALVDARVPMVGFNSFFKLDGPYLRALPIAK
jgi:hypothetical protein